MGFFGGVIKNMDFSGVMLIWLIGCVYFFFKTISLFVKSLRWKSVGVPVIGVIGDPQRMISSTDPHAPCNNYDLHVQYNGKDLKLQYHLDKARYLAPGTEYKLLLNPANNDHILASECFQTPLVSLGCFLLMLLLLLVTFGISFALSA